MGQLRRLAIDVSCIAILALSANLTSYMPPINRGFFCLDTTLRYPVSGETISTSYLLFVTIVVPLGVIIVGDIASLLHYKYPVIYFFLTDPRNILVFWPATSCWTMSFLINWIVIGVLKTHVGRLRPIFYELCAPKVDCDFTRDSLKYLTNFTCTNSEWSKRENFVRSSFPSGHSALSANSSMFIAYYLHKRIDCYEYKYVALAGQLTSLSYAAYIAVSRVSDYMHHWEDVLFGHIIGYAIALLVIATTRRLDYRPILPLDLIPEKLAPGFALPYRPAAAAAFSKPAEQVEHIYDDIAEIRGTDMSNRPLPGAPGSFKHAIQQQRFLLRPPSAAQVANLPHF